MATLGGRTIRTVITNLEVESDTRSHVMNIANTGPTSPVTVIIRLPHEDYWRAEGPTFTLTKEDARNLARILSGEDVSYHQTQLDKIPTARFTAPAPETEQAKPEVDCSQLDIERARAENIKEERELLRLSNLRDHRLDKHEHGLVEGCDLCYDPIGAAYYAGQDAESDAA